MLTKFGKISRITDKLLPMIREWQNRPLESVYTMVMLDAIHYKVREEGTVVRKAVYIGIGTDLDGRKDVLRLLVGATESAKYLMSVLTGLNNRGVEDILIASVDGLTGFSEALRRFIPKSMFSDASSIKSAAASGMSPTKTSRRSPRRSSPSTKRRQNMRTWQRWMSWKQPGAANIPLRTRAGAYPLG